MGDLPRSLTHEILLLIWNARKLMKENQTMYESRSVLLRPFVIVFLGFGGGDLAYIWMLLEK